MSDKSSHLSGSEVSGSSSELTEEFPHPPKNRQEQKAMIAAYKRKLRNERKRGKIMKRRIKKSIKKRESTKKELDKYNIKNFGETAAKYAEVAIVLQKICRGKPTPNLSTGQKARKQFQRFLREKRKPKTFISSKANQEIIN
jgi:hypothetical protein